MSESQRSLEQVREHYEIEKALAAQLRNGSDGERKQLYGKIYDELYRRVPHHPQLTRKVSPEETERAIRQQLRLLNRFINKDATYLEVGPGDCALTLEVAKHVRRAVGVDVSTEITSSDRGAGKFELILSDGTSIPVPPGSVDVAYSNQLMEHLHPDDAHAQLVNLHRALRPGGVYICETPNRLTGPHDISRGFDIIATGLHLREYTNVELFEMFRGCGFERVIIYSSFRGYLFRVPPRLLLGFERWLMRQPAQRMRALLSLSALRKLINNCRLVAVKSSQALSEHARIG